MKKTRDEILLQDYMSASDLKIIMPTMGIQQCRKYINEIQLYMSEKGYFIPKTIPKLALTKIIRKKFGI